MIKRIYDTFILKYPSAVLIALMIFISSLAYYATKLEIDASAETLLLDDDKDLKFFREVNERYNSTDFLVVTFSPKTDLLSKTLYFISSNIFSSLYNLKTEIISILDSTTYFSLVFTICCLFLYCDNVFISPTDISKVFYQHNYNKAKNPEIFLDTIIENFSDKTTKKYQLTRIWDILDIFRNLFDYALNNNRKIHII